MLINLQLSFGEGDNGTQVKLQRFKEILAIVPKEEVSEGKCLSSDVGEGGHRNAAGATKEGCEMQPKPRPARSVIKTLRALAPELQLQQAWGTWQPGSCSLGKEQGSGVYQPWSGRGRTPPTELPRRWVWNSSGWTVHSVFALTFGCSFKAGIRFISMKWEEWSNYPCQWLAAKSKMGVCPSWKNVTGKKWGRVCKKIRTTGIVRLCGASGA